MVLGRQIGVPKSAHFLAQAVVRNLNYFLKILVVTVLLISCKNGTQNTKELSKSNFNLNTDLPDFKKKMSDLDTLRIFFDHSVCDYEGQERIEITKLSDTIIVRSEFREMSNPEWKFVYEKKLPETDTIWQFAKFILRNANRRKPSEDRHEVLVVENKKDVIKLYAYRLVDLIQFMEDYYLTMRKIYPENANEIYGKDQIIK